MKDWYINRYERQKRFKPVTALAQQKKTAAQAPDSLVISHLPSQVQNSHCAGFPVIDKLPVAQYVASDQARHYRTGQRTSDNTDDVKAAKVSVGK
jgi:hypothetical protein